MKQLIKYLSNEDYRIKAETLFDNLSGAYRFLKKHKPSIGSFGEHILRDFFKMMLPKDIDVTQGFVLGNDDELSTQCDIIIYRKNADAIVKSFGDIHVIQNTFVLSIIEVKTRVQRKTFESTLKAFNKLAKIGCCNNYMFIYNTISPSTLCSYFYPTNKNTENNAIEYNVIYDHGDQSYLPIAICNLRSNYCLCQDYVINEYDMFGYVAYQLKDDVKEISCLQMFLGAVFNSFLPSISKTYEEESNNISFTDLKVLYSHGLWLL